MGFKLFLAFIIATAASHAYAQLLSRQPILNQMTGNCYTHSGTDILTGVYLKKTSGREVVQPHPLLLGGIISAHTGRANISSGVACNFFNTAKNTRGEVCSVQAFSRFIARAPGMTTDKMAKSIDKLDIALNTLQDLFEKRSWNNTEKRKARESSGDIISAICSLGGVINLDNPKFTELIDDARAVINTLENRRPATLRSMALDSISGFTRMVASGFGPYLFRRAQESIEFNQNRSSSINSLLNESYQDMNKRCVAYARTNNLPRVPSNFFSTSARFNCVDELFQTPLQNRRQMQPRLDFIARQVNAGYATPISMCGSAFSGSSSNRSDYRRSNGTCTHDDGHAVTVTGVVIRNGKKMFQIRNSWGTDACKSVTSGRRACGGASGCPGPAELDCKDGVYFMSEGYLSKVMYRYGRLTISRQ